MAVAPPGRFSTTIDCPICSCTLAKTVRGMMSVALPGLYGTITRIGFAGQVSSDASAQRPIDRSATIQSQRCDIVDGSCNSPRDLTEERAPTRQLSPSSLEPKKIGERA